MKNYKKIYQRVIKEIKRMKVDEGNYKSTDSNDILRFVDNKQSQYAVSMLNSVLEMNEEIEGKKCNMIIMNQQEFKQWKKSINIVEKL